MVWRRMHLCVLCRPRNINLPLRQLMAYLLSSNECTPARLHWGKAGWPDFGCWNGADAYKDTWCDFGCAVQALDPQDKFIGSAPDRSTLPLIAPALHSCLTGGTGKGHVSRNVVRRSATIPTEKDAIARWRPLVPSPPARTLLSIPTARHDTTLFSLTVNFC